MSYVFSKALFGQKKPEEKPAPKWKIGVEQKRAPPPVARKPSKAGQHVDEKATEKMDENKSSRASNAILEDNQNLENEHQNLQNEPTSLDSKQPDTSQDSQQQPDEDRSSFYQRRRASFNAHVSWGERKSAESSQQQQQGYRPRARTLDHDVRLSAHPTGPKQGGTFARLQAKMAAPKPSGGGDAGPGIYSEVYETYVQKRYQKEHGLVRPPSRESETNKKPESETNKKPAPPQVAPKPRRRASLGDNRREFFGRSRADTMPSLSTLQKQTVTRRTSLECGPRAESSPRPDDVTSNNDVINPYSSCEISNVEADHVMTSFGSSSFNHTQDSIQESIQELNETIDEFENLSSEELSPKSSIDDSNDIISKDKEKNSTLKPGAAEENVVSTTTKECAKEEPIFAQEESKESTEISTADTGNDAKDVLKDKNDGISDPLESIATGVAGVEKAVLASDKINDSNKESSKSLVGLKESGFIKEDTKEDKVNENETQKLDEAKVEVGIEVLSSDEEIESLNKSADHEEAAVVEIEESTVTNPVKFSNVQEGELNDLSDQQTSEIISSTVDENHKIEEQDITIFTSEPCNKEEIKGSRDSKEVLNNKEEAISQISNADSQVLIQNDEKVDLNNNIEQGQSNDTNFSQGKQAVKNNESVISRENFLPGETGDNTEVNFFVDQILVDIVRNCENNNKGLADNCTSNLPVNETSEQLVVKNIDVDAKNSDVIAMECDVKDTVAENKNNEIASDVENPDVTTTANDCVIKTNVVIADVTVKVETSDDDGFCETDEPALSEGFTVI